MLHAPAGRSRTEWFFLLALVLLLVGVSIQYSIKVLTPRKDGYTQSAILRWAKQIQDMDEGENIHAKYNYPNPPIMPQMLWPLAKLAEVSPLAAALTWFLIKVGLFFLCVVWTFRLIETPERPIPAWAKALAIAFSIRPILGDLTHGNVNIFILFLVTASLYSFSRGRDWLAGLLLALSIACKVTPALFVIYFLYKRAWGVLLGCTIGLGLFFFVVPSLIFAVQSGSLEDGWRRNWEALTAWIDGMIVPYLLHGMVTPEKENQSLPGVLTRLLTHSPSFSAWVDKFYVPLAYHNLANLDSATIKRIVQVCQLLFLALMVVICRAPVRAAGMAKSDVRRDWRLAAEYSLLLVAMLLFSERTWKHHCVTLLLPFSVLCYAMACGLPKWRARSAGIAAFVAAALMFTTVSGVTGDDMPKVSRDYDGVSVAVGSPAFVGGIESELFARQELIPDSPGKIAQVYGAYAAAFFVLMAGLTAVLAPNCRQKNQK